MKLLIDENLPKRLKRDLSDHQVFTVREMKWNGLDNGILLQAMLDSGFDVLFTFDKNIRHQQNFEKYPISVLLLIAKNNSYKNIQPLVPAIRAALSSNLRRGVTVIARS